jgi:predicted dehydrogenase
MPERVEALVVGAGLMGRWHAHAVRRAGGVVTGIVDIDPSRANALAVRVGGAKPFPRLEAALEAVRVDVVHVCTPSASHGPLVRTALAGRCHVLSEKPLAATAEETAELLAVATSVGRLLVPVHQFGFQRGMLRLMACLPRLGPIVHLEVACASAGAEGGTEGGADAVAADILPHLLGLTRRLLDVTLAGGRWSVARPRPGEWRVTGRCGDVSIGYLVSMGARPTFAELRVLGERASARADLFHGFAVLERGGISRSSKAARPFRMATGSLFAASLNLLRRGIQREPAYPGLTELVRRVHLAATGRGTSPISPAETLDIAETRDRLITLASSDPRE